MKVTLIKAAMLCLFVLAAVPAWSQQGAETVEPLTVVVGVDHAPPYRILEPGRKTGLYLDMFEEMTNRLGWDVEYREAPFRRLQLMLHRGEIDMMLGLVRNGTREQWMEFVAPAFPPERRLFFYLDDANRVDRYQDLYGKTIGLLEGGSYFSRFDKDPELMRASAAHYENLMLMMQKGRVDVVVAPELVGLYTAKNLGIEARASPFFVPGERSWIVVSGQSPVVRYADDIRAALKLIEREGIRENLVLKYLEQPLP